MVPIQEWSWGASLLIKIGFSGIGVLFVLWVGWPQPPNTPVAGSSEENLLVVSSTFVPPPVAQVRGFSEVMEKKNARRVFQRPFEQRILAGRGDSVNGRGVQRCPRVAASAPTRCQRSPCG